MSSRLETVLRLIDRYTAPMRNIYDATLNAQRGANQATNTFNALQSTLNTFSANTFTSAINSANRSLGSLDRNTTTLQNAFNSVRGTIRNFTEPIRSVYTSTLSAQQGLGRTTAGLNILQGAFRGFNTSSFVNGVIIANQGLELFMKLISGIGVAFSNMTEAIDEASNIRARIDLMNDGLQTTSELQDKIFYSAQRAKASYKSMADSVGKFGTIAGDAFKSNQEMIDFTEIIQKSFKISGATTQMKNSAMLQLTQALGAGKLQGDEYRSIIENAPMIAKAIAKYLGVSTGKLKELSKDGEITASVIKNAMFNASQDIESKFSKMPATFSEVFTKMQNIALKRLDPTFQKIIQILNSPEVMRGIEVIMNGIGMLADGVYYLLQVAIKFGNFVSENWSIIEPILFAIAGMLTAILIPLLWSAVTALWAMVAPVLAQVGAWLTLMWPVLVIGALIGLLIYAMLEYEQESTTVITNVMGVFGGLAVFLQNLVSDIGNYFLGLGDFLANVFRNPVGAIQKLFYDMAIVLMGIFNTISSSIEYLVNLIPGVEVDITGRLQRIEQDVKNRRDLFALENGLTNMSSEYGLDKFSIQTGVDVGEQLGLLISDKTVGALNDVVDSVKNKFGDTGRFDKLGNIDKINSIGTIDKIKDDVNIADEDLKLMREMAEMNAIQNFISLTPRVSTRIGTINNDADSDRLLGQITEQLQREIEASVEGAF